MKNLKIIATTMTSLAFALTTISPLVADAKGLSLGSGLSGNVSVGTSHKTEVSENNQDNNDNNDNNEKDEVHLNSSGNATVTQDKEDNNDNNNEKSLPRGIEKRLENDKGHSGGLLGWFEHFFKKHSTSTVDIILPVIKDVNVVSVGTTTATVTWKTNESTTGDVRFATSSTVDVNSIVVLDTSTSTNHSLVLSGLKANTQYYFTVTAKDSAGNTKVTNVMRFHTTAVALADVTAPSIYFSTTYGTNTSSAHIFWLTNERSDSRVWLSTSSPVIVTGSTTVSVSDKVFLHDVTVSGLASSTTYFYSVGSADASGNMSGAATGSFTTGH